MSKKDQNFDVILKGCQQFAEAVANTRRASALLKREAEVAQGSLKDDVAKKNIGKIMNLAEVIDKTTAAGEERVRELERKKKIEEDEFNRMASR